MKYSLAVHAIRIVPALALSLLLAACGGSESLLSNTTQTNATQTGNHSKPGDGAGGNPVASSWVIASNVLRAIDTAGGLAGLGDQAVSGVALSGLGAPLGVTSLAGTLLDELRGIAARHGIAARQLTGALVAPNFSCGGAGSASFQASDPAVLSFQNCALALGTASGALEITEQTPGAWDAVAGLRFGSGQAGFALVTEQRTLVLAGALTFRRHTTNGTLTTLRIESADAAGLAITSIVATDKGDTQQLTNTLQEFVLEAVSDTNAATYSVAYDGNITDENKTVAAQTTAPFAFASGAGAPVSGALRISTLSGAYVDVTVAQDSVAGLVTLTADEDGAGPAASTEQLTDWGALISGVSP